MEGEKIVMLPEVCKRWILSRDRAGHSRYSFARLLESLRCDLSYKQLLAFENGERVQVDMQTLHLAMSKLGMPPSFIFNTALDEDDYEALAVLALAKIVDSGDTFKFYNVLEQAMKGARHIPGGFDPGAIIY